MFEVFAVGDSRAREVVLNSLRQPGVDFFPWVTRTRKAYKLWATLPGARMVLPPRLCAEEEVLHRHPDSCQLNYGNRVGLSF
jgi:hypothetical protein